MCIRDRGTADQRVGQLYFAHRKPLADGNRKRIHRKADADHDQVKQTHTCLLYTSFEHDLQNGVSAQELEAIQGTLHKLIENAKAIRGKN